MKSTEDIKDVLFTYIKNSDLYTTIKQSGGELYRTESMRKPDDRENAIILGVIGNALGKWQIATCNVNIYIKDIQADTISVEDSKTLKEVTAKALSMFDNVVVNGILINNDSQSTYDVSEKCQHCSNVRLEVRISN